MKTPEGSKETMETLQPMLEAIRHEVEPVMERLDPHALDRAVQSICQARHIFVAGMGRSGYMMRAADADGPIGLHGGRYQHPLRSGG